MFKAKNANGEIIHIDQVKEHGEYYCPICSAPMITRLGRINVHHFAHKRALCDDWYSENKGPWHKSMQDLFKEEYREVALWKNNDKSTHVFHIADICIPNADGTKLIVEFQHSPMNAKEFAMRNNFYMHECAANGKSNKILWVFDYLDKSIFFSKSKQDGFLKAEWKRASQTLRFFKPEQNYFNSNARVLFHVRNRRWTTICSTSEFYNEDGEFQEYDHYKKEFKGDTGKAMFILPRYQYKNWRYFGGWTVKEEEMFNWAKRK